MNKVINFSNNESVALGVFQNADGSFTAVTFSASKEFKTVAGAKRWLAKRGINI